MPNATLCETCDRPIPSDSREAVEVAASEDNPYRIDFCSLECALAGIRDRRREVDAIRRATGTDDPAGYKPEPAHHLWNPYEPPLDADPPRDSFIVEDRRS